MARIKKINVGGAFVEAAEIGFRPSGEHWNEYLLDDGSVMRIKLVLTDVVRVEGQYNDQGDPIYFANTTNVMSVSAPEELRRQDDAGNQ